MLLHQPLNFNLSRRPDNHFSVISGIYSAMKKIIITLTIVLLVACTSKAPQQMSPRELAKCAWKGNTDCQAELQHRLQVKRGTVPAANTAIP
ncbi:hypothetical protein ACI1BE_002896 [Cronobacter turicensis]|uniref:hypothetical protein n=1 Tax=Cronobacter turicensis TaxID=413502 RepID=UPI0035715284